MRISVVISTLHRADSLRLTLAALRFQRHRDFEVVVVEGPSEVGWGRIATEQHRWVRRVSCPEANLARSRNLGVAAASGEVVAFVDDDAVPEPRWLTELAVAYEDERVAGAGGIVLDSTGMQPQYEYALCDRLGRPSFERRAPSARETIPGADPFLYLQGTNMSFRREALVAIGGFDEQLVYLYDDVDICLRMIDAGALLVPLAGAPVHHRCLASPVRRADGLIYDPFAIAQGRTCFAFRHGSSPTEAERSLFPFAQELRQAALDARAAGRFSATELEHFMRRLEQGLESGRECALAAGPNDRVSPARPTASFKPYPRLTCVEGQLRVCVLSPARTAGRDVDGERPEADRLARRFAAQGHEVHLFRGGAGQNVVEFDGAVWTHDVQVQDRALAALADEPVALDLYAAAAYYQEVQRLHRYGPVDTVLTSLVGRESLICSLDGRFPARARLLPSPGEAHRNGEPVHIDELADALQSVAGIDPASARQTAADLLDGASYPFDLVAAIVGVWEAPAARFADVVFRAALGREPDQHTRAVWQAHISAGHSRHHLLEGALCSAEARERGIQPDTLARFRRRLAAWAPVQLRRAWTLPDRAFVHAAYQWTLGRTPDPEHGALAMRDLQRGASRLDVLARLTESAEARERGMPAGMLELLRSELRSTPPQRVEDALGLSDAEFVRGPTVAVMSRMPDESSHES